MQRAGLSYVVPAFKGACPTFAARVTVDKKKVAIAEFILSEQDIPKSEACDELLKNQLLGAVLSVWGQLIFFSFSFLCLIWHVIERYG